MLIAQWRGEASGLDNPGRPTIAIKGQLQVTRVNNRPRGRLSLKVSTLTLSDRGVLTPPGGQALRCGESYLQGIKNVSISGRARGLENLTPWDPWSVYGWTCDMMLLLLYVLHPQLDPYSLDAHDTARTCHC